MDNSVCEAFNGSARRECLAQQWCASLAEAEAVLSAWRAGYNNHRPHSGLDLMPPASYLRAGSYRPRYPARKSKHLPASAPGRRAPLRTPNLLPDSARGEKTTAMTRDTAEPIAAPAAAVVAGVARLLEAA